MAVLSGPYVSLASGIGGLDAGVAAATGGRAFAVLYVERELTAAAVLAARMEDGALSPAPVWSDLRLLDARLLRDKVAGVVAGFPCQPYSVAGKQRGEADDRDLWPECLRVVREAGPDWCFFENVGGSVREFVRRFGPDLERAGYRAAAGLYTAAEVGAIHDRPRLFFLAVSTDPTGVGYEEQGHDRDHAHHRSSDGTWRTSRALDALARGAVPVVCRDHDGLPGGLALSRADQLRLLGNAVVPAQAEHAMRDLMARL